MTTPSIRTLRRDERAAVLDLLDEWPLSDGWRGRDYFRRYIDSDPHYADENFHVAELNGALISCVQIFPRELRAAGTTIPIGGIGSVFTSEKARGTGVASRLLEASVAAMRERGMEVSLLFASRHDFYTRLGWTLWPRQRSLWIGGDALASPDASLRVADFEIARDLDDVMALHARYAASRHGTTLRDRALWLGTLAFAGNPTEEFRVARDAAGRILAYTRASLFVGFCAVLELGRDESPAAVAALADLVLRCMTPREDDPFATRAAKTSAAFRRSLLAPCHDDAPLDAALALRGVVVKHFEEKSSMLRVLDAEALARRCGASPGEAGSSASLLRRVLPPARLVCWPADRF
jgi:GNAT superfamily N-acetyltransferase